MLSTITNMKFSKFLTLLLQSLVDLKFQTFHIRTLQKNVAEENKKSCKRSHPFFFIILISLHKSFGQALFISSRSMESIFS